MSTLYPFFHPNRSKFFNMVTLYKATLEAIDEGLEQAFPDRLLNFFSSERITDKSYLKWEVEGGVDRSLPAFKLTNRQMLWVCMAHTIARKFHRNSPKHINEKNRIVNDNLHIHFKQFSGFRDAFECDNLTSDEEKKLKEYRNMLASFNERQRNKKTN